MLTYIIIASAIGGILSLVGGVLLLFREKFAKKISLYLVSLAVGGLLGAAFLDLLPEAIEESSPEFVMPFAIVGIIILFFFEKLLKWYHCHDRETCDYHTFSSTVLFGDAVHNFIDGVIIALSFSLGVEVGIATTIAVFFHEIPQEIGDFGVLMHAGWKRSKILLANFLTATATILGAVIGYFALSVIEPFLPQLVAFAAGSFIYIAVSDLMPELRHEAKPREFFHIFVVLLGILAIATVGMIFKH